MFLVFCNCPLEQASTIARKLVQEHLAACVNLLPPVTSFYQWEGKLCEDREQTLLIKVSREGYLALYERLLVLHPHKTPEIIATPVELAHPPYLEWVRAATPPKPASS